MVKSPKAKIPAEKIARINPNLVFRPHCPATDPAVGHLGEPNEFFLKQDKLTQNKLMVVRLEAEAAVQQAVAAGHLKMAGLLKSNG
jgi:hypothetical protein